MHPALSRVDHRPWELPGGPWRWRQVWADLLFAHWPVPAAALRSLVPPPLEIQEFDGTSWVGIVPFRMEGVMLRPLPDIPGLSAFPELNVRLYVELEGKPGIWFISLDAGNWLAVKVARRLFHLPYFHASMHVDVENEQIRYRSVRKDGQSQVMFTGSYRPVSPVREARAGTLEHFLAERYCLYAGDQKGRIFRAEVHHHPWPLQTAEAEIEENTMASAQGIEVEGEATLFHFSRRLEVVVWSPRRVA